ncbi:MAG: 3,5-cyclic-AMP phosphodiesterase [Nocardioidaceae bacterium]|nr:3,5-cyclic-AMP phosphodiesterase [Nocardioidaceae bacterium]
MTQFGQLAPPSHVVAHVSDTHLLAGDAQQYDAIDTVSHFRSALERLTRIDPPPQAIVVTGDLADLGEPEAYRRLRELVEPFAEAVGAQVVWCMGNHDERAAFSRELFGEESDAPQDRVYDVRGLRIVSLDTSVPGWHHGEITDEQLAWLRDELATPAEHGTILALHHPPIPSPLVPAAEIIELLDTDRLADVVRGSDVRAILGGHYHFTSHSTFAGIPVSVAAATCYVVDTAPLDRLISAVDGHQAFNVVHVYDDRVVHSIVPVPDAPEVDGFGADMLPLLEALRPEERLDMVSRKDSPLNTGQLDLDAPPVAG